MVAIKRASLIARSFGKTEIKYTSVLVGGYAFVITSVISNRLFYYLPADQGGIAERVSG